MNERSTKRIGFYQFCPTFGEIDRNLAQVIDALRDVQADVVVLPELAFTGYCFRDRAELESLAENPQASPTVRSLIDLCRNQSFYLVSGFAERALDKCFNSALLLGPEGLIGTYRKLHLFGTEVGYFDPGDIPLTVHRVRGIGVGMMVCFDWAFPEVARALALTGAEVLCHPANLVLTYCQQTMIARCIENAVFAVTANRYGTEAGPRGSLAFTGQSQIVAPKGELLHRSRTDRDDVCIAQVDISLARNKTLTPQNDLFADRRPGFYAKLCEPQPSEG